MARQLFGTDGIRGEANRHPMTADIAFRTGRALAFMVGIGRLGRGPTMKAITPGNTTLLPTSPPPPRARRHRQRFPAVGLHD